MPLRLRYVLTMLAMAVLSSVAVAATVQVVLFGPQLAPPIGRDQFRAWLVDQQGQQVSLLHRQRLARRLELELSQSIDWKPIVEPLSKDSRETLADNVAHLLGILLVQRVEQYQRLPVPERRPWLEQQMQAVMQWPIPTRNGRIAGSIQQLRPADLSRIVEHAKSVNEGRVDPQMIAQAEAAIVGLRMMGNLQQWLRPQQ